MNAITDRDTFVNMFDSEAALKDGASDLGFTWLPGPYRISASLLASSLRGKLRRSCLRPSSRQMQLPELTVFQSHCSHVIGPLFSPSLRTSSESIFPTTSFPLNLCSKTSRNALPDGTLKAEPLSHVVSLFEEEQQDAKRPDPTRQYNLQLDSKLTITTKRRHLSSEPTDEKGLPPQVFDHDSSLAARSDAAARALYLRRF